MAACMHEREEEERKESSISLKVAHVHCLSVKEAKEGLLWPDDEGSFCLFISKIVGPRPSD